MDMATELRANMAARQMTVAEVAALVGRNRMTVSKYRTGQLEIPLDVARLLNREGLVSDEAILGKDAA
jgi:transcriptional regulator with XRE-family HTH domain